MKKLKCNKFAKLEKFVPIGSMHKRKNKLKNYIVQEIEKTS